MFARKIHQCVYINTSIYTHTHTNTSMAPAAPPGKPRCWVSEGVGCLKVLRERGPGFPRPREAKKFEPPCPLRGREGERERGREGESTYKHTYIDNMLSVYIRMNM